MENTSNGFRPSMKINTFNNGDTIQTENTRNISSIRAYCGNFEWNQQRCVYHTDEGYYSIKDKAHYWYVRDRLGSTVAVVDRDGNLLQVTGYYPSGTPYQIPDVSLATAVDAKTDQLHIGNRWIGFKGLDIYDNTARMHDPLLGRFHTVDPLWRKYPSQSPWSHCMANPINFIDPSGFHPIYSKEGAFLGTDDEGLQGDFIVMDGGKFKQNMSIEDAQKYAIDTSEIESTALNAISYHHKNILPTRPDYDGVITHEEAKYWYKYGPENTDGKRLPLFADFRKLDLTGFVSNSDFEKTNNPVINLAGLGFLTGEKTSDRINQALVYGNITLVKYENPTRIKAYADEYNFDIQLLGNPIRNLSTIAGKLIVGSGKSYDIIFYGSISIP